MAVQNSWTYRDRTSTSETEYYIEADRYLVKNSRMRVLVREDLGLVYSLIPSRKQYYIDTIPDEEKSPEVVKEVDLKYAWQERYNPDYEWKIMGSMGDSTLHGYQCEGLEVSGEAAFSFVKAEVWLSRELDAVFAKRFTDIVKKDFSYDKGRQTLSFLLVGRKRYVPLRITETIDGSISGPTKHCFEVVEMKQSEVPDSLWLIPENYTLMNK